MEITVAINIKTFPHSFYLFTSDACCRWHGIFVTNRIHSKHTSVCANSNHNATNTQISTSANSSNIFVVAVETHQDTSVQEDFCKHQIFLYFVCFKKGQKFQSRDKIPNSENTVRNGLA